MANEKTYQRVVENNKKIAGEKPYMQPDKHSGEGLNERDVSAVALFSGGLDSLLAVEMVREQGVKVFGVTFSTPFFTPETAIKASKDLNLPLKIIDFTEEHLEIIKNPSHGYGKNLNPCIDCHALMVKRAGEYMEEIGAQFIITGEVLGERPMSQNYKALQIVEKDSGYQGLVLRPLSAKMLPPTTAEEKGWVDRERLEGIQGRSRKPQIALAEKYALREYPSPAGGCLLTVESISKRLKDLLQQEGNISRSDLELLKVGRHFRLGERVKIVVGRDKEENQKIEGLVQKNDLIIKVANMPGPTTLYRGEWEEASIQLGAGITARYSDAGPGGAVVRIWKSKGGGKGDSKELELEKEKENDLELELELKLEKVVEPAGEDIINFYRIL